MALRLLRGKAAIVTGGASGIGEACSETLAREGASVLITDIDDALGKAVVERITKAGGKARYLHHDVRDEAAWPGVIAEAEKHFGRLDIMVANAGIGVMAPIETMTLADWQRQQAINLDGVFLSIKHAIPALQSRGRRLDRADVVDRGPARRAGARRLLGDQGRRAAAGQVGGAGACRRQHPLQLGASRHHRHADLGQDPDRRRGQPPQRADRSASSARRRSMPLVRVGEAQDIANGVLFLCTEAANYMTGQELVIDGGITAGGRPQPRPQ